ncbi:MAG: ABC transporter ATP-binding protein, partial [bacterium]
SAMSLIEVIPKPPDGLLNGQGARVVIAVASDLTSQGTFGDEWLIVTEQKLRVFQPGNVASPRLELEMAAITVAEIEGLIGGGALLVTLGNETREVLRFSNACQKKFAHVAKYLQDLAKYREDLKKDGGKNLPPEIEEDKDEAKRCPTCRLLLPEGSNVCPACLNKGKVLLRIVKYLRPYVGQTSFVWITMFIGLVVGLVPPYLTRPLMDKVLVPADAGPVEDRLKLLGLLVLGLLGTQVLGNAVGIIRSRAVVRLGAHLSNDLRIELYAHLQRLSLRFFQKRQVGSLISRVMSDTQALERVLVDGIQYLVVNMLTLVGIGIVLFIMNWKLALAVLIPMPIVIILSRASWHHIHSLWHRYWHYRSRITAAVSDTLSGIRVVKAFAKEEEEIVRFRTSSETMMTSDMHVEQTGATFFPILWFITSTGSLLVWYFGGQQVLRSEISLGTLMTFQAYLAMFYGPLQFLSHITDFLARSLTSAERVFEVLDSAPEVRDVGSCVRMPEIKGRVELRNVTFGYEAHKPILKNITLDVAPGEMIGLVGRSGVGKSTTINLICRFYDVQQGELLIDGVNVRDIHQKDLRSQIGVVLQDTFLFDGTIAENIAYARPDASLEDIMSAAYAANAHDFIAKKADGYDTKVGERGQGLSAGERQRIAIARAILHNPKILILD